MNPICLSPAARRICAITAFGAAIVGGDNGRQRRRVDATRPDLATAYLPKATPGPTEIDRSSDADTTPVVVNGVVYALAYGNLTALICAVVRLCGNASRVRSSMTFIVDGDRVYRSIRNDRALVLTTDGGVTLWTQKRFAAPFADPGTV